MDKDELGDSGENAMVKLASLLVIGAGLIALFLDYSWFWMVFAVGFAVLVPMVKLATDELGVVEVPDGSTAESRRDSQSDRLGTDAPESKQDALDTLRTRYASGELSEAEFERKVEQLLETETLEGARDHVANRADSAHRADSDDRGARSRDDEADAERRERDRATE